MNTGRNLPALAVGEVQHKYKINYDISAIETLGYEEKSLIGLDAGCWISGDKPDTTAGTINNLDIRIKYIFSRNRRIASNGLALWAFSLTIATCGGRPIGNSAAETRRSQLNDVIYNNYYAISPSVIINNPQNNSVVTDIITIDVTPQMNNITNSPITSYRYFVDNKLIKIQSEPSLELNTANYSDNQHIITVHAVADDYMSGSVQSTIITNNGNDVCPPPIHNHTITIT